MHRHARKVRRLGVALTVLIPLAVATPVASAVSEHPATTTSPAECALPGRTGWTDEGHDTDYNQFQRPIGTKHALMLFVDFPDAQATDSTAGYYDELAPAADWMQKDSYGRVKLDITPVDRWLRMPQESTTYGFDRGITFEEHELYVRQAVQAADPDVDFSQYDMVYIVPTKAAKAIKFPPTSLYAPATAGIVADGKRVKWGVTFGQDMWRWGYKVVNHETSHIFGLPDLYAFTGTDYHRYVHGWDLMGNIAGPAPAHVGWHRWKFGWIDDNQVACLSAGGSRAVHLKAVESPGGTKIAVIRTGETTAYVAESRRAIRGDAKACSTGVLIYKVDSSTQTGYGPIQVVNGNPEATPPSGCLPLDMAAFRPGQSFTDPTTGVRIDVKSSSPLHDDISITKQ
ncbi:M6 family metalloprotease domain-containing protein [Streptomyces lunaelactis]|uniref:M6 family metalloprotease domain-containing protein n=1 Tax=Streptomyces lunaelactis TaxID=1535768 RepID=UPI0015855EE8|nr:M6 family metalloprotease domain-containing protein [Streptomyces lunaelactis]NUK41102.1 M6 family metalloprotease domain-containing protein [Streptomyces lunaelactis]